MTRLPAFAVVLAGLLMFSVSASQAAPGSLDPTFGARGKVTTVIGEGGGALAVAVQPDGKIVAAGYAWGDYGGFALARYNTDASLDQSFGAGGKVITQCDGTSSAWGVAIQPDGRIVAAGVCWKSDPSRSYFELVRYERDGSLDTGFGSDGVALTAIGQWSWAFAVAVQPDGKLVAGGSGGNGFALVRYKQDGSLDAGFGNDGIVTGTFTSVRALALNPDGKIVVLGTHYEGDQDRGFALARYNSDGSLDPTFGSDGRVETVLDGCYAFGEAIALQPDDRIVVAGTTSTCSHLEFAVARYRTDGSLDASFGAGGTVLTPVGTGNSQAHGVAVQPDGKILVAGRGGDGAIVEFALARYEPNGSLDHSFGTDGRVLTAFGFRNVFRSGWAYAVAIEPDGKLVAAGGADPLFYGGTGFAVARYLVASGCLVPDVVGAWLAEARDAIAPSGCSLAPIKRAYSRKVEKGFVISQRPATGAALSEGAPVHLVVSKGRRRKP